MASGVLTEHDPLLVKLNDRQREAVTHGEGPLLVLAGAGSGKTRVLTHRIAWLVGRAGVDPRQILALTFTNKAASEMRERVEKLLGPAASQVWLGTFHSIALRILRRHADLLEVGPDFAVYDADDQRRLAKKVVESLNLDPKKFNPNALVSLVSREKDEGRGPDQSLPGAHDRYSETFRDFYRAYQKRLSEARALDFGDLLTSVLSLFATHPEVADHYSRRFRHLLIDEYQDTNRVQYLLAKRIAEGWGNIAVVGDDDQSIYGWRGADVGNILGFPDRFEGTRIVKLEQNYRSTSLILDAAGSVIDRNEGRMGKRLWTEREGGDPVRLFVADNEEEEARWIAGRIRELLASGQPPSEVAILYRVHALSRAIEEALLDRGHPYRVFGGLRFYERREIKDLLSFLRLSVNPSDPVAFYRVVNLPPRGIGDKTVDMVSEESARRSLDLWLSAREVAAGRLGSGRANKHLAGFVALVEGWREVAGTMPVASMLDRIIEETGYRLYLETEKESRGFDRLENVEELLNAARAYDGEGNGGVAGFLDRAALVTDLDRQEGGGEAVTLMTVHSAKGLEFRNVFIAGMEEGVFPHQMSMGSPSELEEERRLCYVAMTRAGERLYLTRSRMRRVYGAMSEARMPSRFLRELPEELRPREEAPVYSSPRPWRDLPRMPERRAAAPTWRPSVSPAEEDTGDEAGGGSWFLPEPAEARYRTGMRVRHAKYGAGRVTGVSGDGPTGRVIVKFGDGSERTFVAGPSKLEIHLDG